MRPVMLRHFKKSEFDCKHTGKNKMSPAFLQSLDELREVCGFPFVIISGYRDPSHPKEVIKKSPGTHAKGIAADIKITDSVSRYKIVSEALRMGFRGIGVAKTFVHIDDRDGTPVYWLY